MAREVIIRIISEEGSVSASPSANQSAKASSPSTDASKSKSKARTAFAAYVTSQAVSQIMSQGEYYFGKYLNSSDNYTLANMVSNAKTVVSSLSSIASATIAGSVFGPVGAVLGFAFSAGSTVIQALDNYGSAIQNIHQQAYSNYFYGTRAGFVDGGRGTNN